MINQDEKWMRVALHEALKAEKEHEVPVGAILVKDNTIIAKAHNQPILKNDATAHAEIQVLRKAGAKQKNYRLVGSTLYVTLEPCAMCLGAIMIARVKRLVYGASDIKTGVCGSCGDLSNSKFFHHKITITNKVLEKECSEILKKFFKIRRQNMFKY
jgi:tRNA(adenine34) deaminase